MEHFCTSSSDTILTSFIYTLGVPLKDLRYVKYVKDFLGVEWSSEMT